MNKSLSGNPEQTIQAVTPAALKPIGDLEFALGVNQSKIHESAHQQPESTRKYTFPTEKPYKSHSALLPSGLLGPVQVIAVDAGGKTP